MTEAKPCPFCGGTNIPLGEGSTFRWVVMECVDCGGRCGAVRRPPGGAASDDYESAVAEWNRRTP